MRNAKIGEASVSRLCIGGNPFSGFSHQNSARDQEMRDYFSNERIWQTLREAEQMGINTVFARTDDHIMGVLKEYWQKDGTIQWFAQVCTNRNEPDSWKKWLKKAAELGATALYIHGGVVDNWYANEQFENFYQALEMMREYGKVAGFAGHQPEAHKWIRDHVEADFQMCSHYNPTARDKSPHHSNVGEKWERADRDAMLHVIETLQRPVVHYKVFAGGNKPIKEAFEVLGKSMNENDVVCVGIFPKDDPDMMAKDIAFFEKYVEI